LNGVRELETTLSGEVQATALCILPERPAPDVAPIDMTARARMMNDLLVLALQCDVTRIATYMLDNSRSDLAYSWVPRRDYESNPAGVEAPGGGMCTNYHAAQSHAGISPDYASITRWHIEVAADLLAKLDAVPEGVGEMPAGTLLDNTLVQFSSAMHHGDHAAFDLPFLLFGGGDVFRQNEIIMFPEAVEDMVQLRDLYYTILNSYFDLGEESFGQDMRGLANRTLEELLK
jgi:hypothetical protein